MFSFNLNYIAIHPFIIWKLFRKRHMVLETFLKHVHFITQLTTDSVEQNSTQGNFGFCLMRRLGSDITLPFPCLPHFLICLFLLWPEGFHPRR